MTSKKLKFPGVFVTATDTNAGKTTLAAGLAGYLKSCGFNVGVMKPVAIGAVKCESGKLLSQDVQMLAAFSSVPDPWEWVNPYCLATQATPFLSAKIGGVTIDFEHIRDCFHKIAAAHDVVVVEGAGGVMTPLTEKQVMADLIKSLGIPALVVSRATFGTINHTLMTHECLKARSVHCAGFFVNRYPSKPNLSESTAAEVIVSISNLPLLGTMPELGELFSQTELIDTFARSLNQDAFEEAFYL